MSRQSIPALFLALVILLLPPTGARADFQEEKTFSTDRLVLVDLLGQVRVVGHEGDDFRVEVAVRGRDADPERVRIETEESGGESRLLVRFPVDEERDYVYPELGRGSRTEFRFDPDDEGGSWLSKLFDHSSRIRVRGSGDGLEVWADVTVHVPEGAEVEVYLGCGAVDARDAVADLRLDTHAGSVAARRIQGDVLVDTGSGSVEAEEIRGRLTVDTGSGSVEIQDVEGDAVEVDTGSGSVRCAAIRCRELVVDTGSGGVRAHELSADEVSIDTGSGGIELELTTMGTGDFELDTGSGGIELTLPREASADLEAETGSGRIRVDLEGARIDRMERDYVRLRLGDGAARIHLDTGSGGIRIGH
jgi:hypothetical protein